MEDNKKLPKEDLSDYAYALAKGTLGAIPIAGSLASEAFNLIVSPPLKKRMDRWLESLYEEIEKLKVKSIAYHPENLSKNERFISTIIAATQMAVKTHNVEKLTALKHATLNSVISPDINYEHSLFLNFIDSLTPLHIRALKRFYYSNGSGSPVKSFEDFAKLDDNEIEIEIERTILPSILFDLENRSLIEKDYYTSDSYSRRTPPEVNFIIISSEFGKRFYEFITSK